MNKYNSIIIQYLLPTIFNRPTQRVGPGVEKRRLMSGLKLRNKTINRATATWLVYEDDLGDNY